MCGYSLMTGLWGWPYRSVIFQRHVYSTVRAFRLREEVCSNSSLGLTVGLGEHEINVSKHDLRKFNIVRDVKNVCRTELTRNTVTFRPSERQPTMFAMRQNLYPASLRTPLSNSNLQTSSVRSMALHPRLGRRRILLQHAPMSPRRLFLG